MAKLVLWAGGNREPSESDSYRAGDVICVLPDDTNPGTEVVPPRFFCLQFNGVPVDHPRLMALIEQDIDGGGLRRRLRKWRIRRSDLPVGVRQTWAQDPDHTIYISVPGYSSPGSPAADYTWNQVKTFIRNKVTNQDVGSGEGF